MSKGKWDKALIRSVKNKLDPKDPELREGWDDYLTNLSLGSELVSELVSIRMKGKVIEAVRGKEVIARLRLVPEKID